VKVVEDPTFLDDLMVLMEATVVLNGGKLTAFMFIRLQGDTREKQ
jgi:hypothetical protein